MKILFYLLATVCILENFEVNCDDDHHKMLHDKCVAEVGVDESLTGRQYAGDLPTDQKFKCYLKCVMVTMGVMDDDGNTDEDKFIGILPEPYKSIWAGPIKKCGTIKGTCSCDTAYKTQMCYKKEDPEHYWVM